MPAPKPRLFLRVVAGGEPLLGPGRASLLEGIDRHGSISAAARVMKMSYRRAWLHVDALGRLVGAPVVETEHGGRRGGGAALTAEGRRLLSAFLRLQRKAEAAVERELGEIARLAKPRPRGRR